MHPRIKPAYSIVAHSPDIAELRYGAWNATSLTLRDETQSGSLTRLLLRLDGTLSADGVAAVEAVATREVDALIAQLADLDVIETAPSSALEMMLDRVRPVADGSAADWAPMPVALVGDDELAAEIVPLLRGAQPDLLIDMPSAAPAPMPPALDGDDDTLAFQELLTHFTGWRGRLVIALSPVVDLRLLHGVNRLCLALATPWLNGVLDGPFLFVGPLTLPHRSACFDCFETRVTMNLREAANYQHYKRALVAHQVRTGALPNEPVLRALLATHAAIEAQNFLLTGHSNLINKVLSVYLPTMEFVYHEVLRLPNCRSCGASPASVTGRETYFDAAAILHRVD